MQQPFGTQKSWTSNTVHYTSKQNWKCLRTALL